MIYSIPKYEICKVIGNVETVHDFVVLSYIIVLTQPSQRTYRNQS